MKLFLVLFFIFLSSAGFSQDEKIFKSYLKEELKGQKDINIKLKADFNNDGKKDFAIVLQNKIHKDQVTLYMVYSDSNFFHKEKVYELADTMDLRIQLCEKNTHCTAESEKINPFNSVRIDSNDWEYLFSYDVVLKITRLIWSKQIGP